MGLLQDFAHAPPPACSMRTCPPTGLAKPCDPCVTLQNVTDTYGHYHQGIVLGQCDRIDSVSCASVYIPTTSVTNNRGVTQQKAG